jgi:hypothetical protein
MQGFGVSSAERRSEGSDRSVSLSLTLSRERERVRERVR